MSKDIKIKLALTYLTTMDDLLAHIMDKQEEISEEDLDSFLRAMYSAITVAEFIIPFSETEISEDQE